MYEYKDLINVCKAHPTQENINTLAEWFERYGRELWNGECYEVSELNSRLFPIYKHDENEYTVTGWELI